MFRAIGVFLIFVVVQDLLGKGFTAAVGAVAYGGYKAIEAINKNTDVYAPDRPLPNTPDGVHLPDTDAPHTQIGIKKAVRGHILKQESLINMVIRCETLILLTMVVLNSI